MTKLAGSAKSTYVQKMFDSIAHRYDLMNAVMTFGQHQAMRRSAARIAQPPRHGIALDLATGTGDLALAVGSLQKANITFAAAQDTYFSGSALIEGAEDANFNVLARTSGDDDTSLQPREDYDGVVVVGELAPAIDISQGTGPITLDDALKLLTVLLRHNLQNLRRKTTRRRRTHVTFEVESLDSGSEDSATIIARAPAPGARSIVSRGARARPTSIWPATTPTAITCVWVPTTGSRRLRP